MTTEHKNIVDAQLHEPKGAAAAANHEVFVADGVGSGAFELVDSANINSGSATDVKYWQQTGLGAPLGRMRLGQFMGRLRLLGTPQLPQSPYLVHR